MPRRDSILRGLLRERFVVTMKSGETFDGIIDRADGSLLELVDAFAVEQRGRTSVDGRLYLPREGVAYLQRPEVR